ncbi:flagellar hook-basal body protein [Tepidibacter formicigenes]|jgi:flagellar basal-body rod protein FlgG|uniref:Flagellar basal-body rod protein FlgG n=1 Tax=Tepidibacter formicigenes DSM 15518 TaxID=1123349 RepID=A0A1M6SQW5_9FIRM|nr:flagellar hook-basal body protein [Tepidibacter formicigenes]SHK46978.1 flagellar basal-body rod protein FlgG [Tepidibacter formicigenes DSM 15518]
MFRGLYTVTSAMQTNQKKLDVVTNNIANANTNGFKKDVVISEAFPEKLISKINPKLPSNPNNKGSLEVKRDGEGFFVTTPKGFFTVDSPMGKSYNRSLRFAVDEQGYLKTYTRDINKGVDTTTGFYVLDSNGNKIQAPNNNIEIDKANGNILSNGQVIGNLIYNPHKNVIGTINGGLRLDRIQTNFKSGQLIPTNNKLDFAIKGDGFFKIQTQDGIRYTRDGSFLTNNKGELITQDGNYVLGKNGTITIDKDFKVTAKGELYIDDSFVDQLDIVNVLNVNVLRKEGNNLYKVEENVNPNEQEFKGELLQGSLEGSNVSSINEMVDMITILREYESNQKVVKAYDEMLGKAVNEIGKV